MFGHLSHTRVLRYAGLFTWALVALPLAYNHVSGSNDHLQTHVSWLIAAYVGFGAGYWWLTRNLETGGHSGWLERLALVALTCSALFVSYASWTGLGSILMMLAAGVIPWLLPARAGLAWLMISQLAVYPVYTLGLHMPGFEALMQTLLYGGFSTFIFVTSLVARQQAHARDVQRRLNAELRATRVLLAESARVNERTRISRELHDLLGHHLTALSLNLEVAGHLTEGQAQEHVRQAHVLAKLLLTDVREAVSTMRDSGSIDLAAALSPLAEGVPSLRVELDMPVPLEIDDPELAHVMLRCAQEIITNTVRHAPGARHLLLRIARREGRLLLNSHDDGPGVAAAALVAGNGLRGMRERVAQQGGTVEIQTAPGQGFAMTVMLPETAPGITLSGIVEESV
jgi:signal transduction histidine kinase